MTQVLFTIQLCAQHDRCRNHICKKKAQPPIVTMSCSPWLDLWLNWIALVLVTKRAFHTNHQICCCIRNIDYGLGNQSKQAFTYSFCKTFNSIFSAPCIGALPTPMTPFTSLRMTLPAPHSTPLRKVILAPGMLLNRSHRCAQFLPSVMIATFVEYKCVKRDTDSTISPSVWLAWKSWHYAAWKSHYNKCVWL